MNIEELLPSGGIEALASQLEIPLEQAAGSQQDGPGGGAMQRLRPWKCSRVDPWRPSRLLRNAGTRDQ